MGNLLQMSHDLIQMNNKLTIVAGEGKEMIEPVSLSLFLPGFKLIFFSVSTLEKRRVFMASFL